MAVSGQSLRKFWAAYAVAKKQYHCYNYLNGNHSRGYAYVSMGGKRYTAHRYSLEMKLGRPIRDGMLACHHCENPYCINPHHIYEGTNSENSQDAHDYGRHKNTNYARGERNHNTKLTQEQRQELKDMYATGEWSQKQLAKEFGVSQVAVCKILKEV